MSDLKRTYEWYVANKPKDIKAIEAKKENFITAYKVAEAIKQLSNIPDQKYIVINIDYLPDIPPDCIYYELDLKEKNINELLKNAAEYENQTSQVFTTNNFANGSKAYEDCDKYNSWLSEAI